MEKQRLYVKICAIGCSYKRNFYFGPGRLHNSRLNRVSTLITAFFFVALAAPALSQDQQLASGIYSWRNAGIEKAKSGEPIQLLRGSTTDLESLLVDVVKIKPGATLAFGVQSGANKNESDVQRLMIIKDGTLQVIAGNQSRTVGTGSVAMADAPGIMTLKNVEDKVATAYLLKFKVKEKPDADRINNSKGSFIVDWNETVFKAHERGGRRDIYDTSTKLFDRFEMHVTTLKEGISSHDPHRHAAEEIILLMKGDAEMLIGETRTPLLQWSIGFVDSQVLHGITENGNGTRQYYAFQWQVHK